MKDPTQMTSSELTSWLRERLCSRGTAAADVNIRRGEAPYERPAALWKSGSEDFRNNFRRAVLHLVEEAGAAPWEPAHFNELVLLLEAANLWEAVSPLETIAQSRGLLQHEHGPQLHMLARRTLLALGWKGTLEFWLAQKQWVGNRWPGIIFAGLARQDVELAFSQLPDLATGREAMREILNMLPGLMRAANLGISEARANGQRVVASLRPEAAELLREWFRLRDYPLEPNEAPANGNLRAALRAALGNESEPRFRNATLRGRFNNDCVFA